MTPPSTEELKAAIASYIDAVNAKPKPFVWTKSADDILASVKRFCAATLNAAQTQTTISLQARKEKQTWSILMAVSSGTS